MHRYGKSKTTWSMMATVCHVTSNSGLRKFQAAWFLLNRVYKNTILYKTLLFTDISMWTVQTGMMFYNTVQFTSHIAEIIDWCVIQVFWNDVESFYTWISFTSHVRFVLSLCSQWLFESLVFNSVTWLLVTHWKYWIIFKGINDFIIFFYVLYPCIKL
jgi:hypothetical protein